MTDRPGFKDALVFTGGGTGGHFFPAVALAEGARKRWPGRPIAFVGATRGIEAKRLPESGWPHLLLDVEGFLGRSPLAVLRSLWKLWQARRTAARPVGDGSPLGRGRHRWLRFRSGGAGREGPGHPLLPARIQCRARDAREAPVPGRAAGLVRHGGREGPASGRRLPAGGHADPCGFPAGFRPLGEPGAALSPPGAGGQRRGPGPERGDAGGSPRTLLERFPDWEILHQTGARDFQALENRERHPRHRIQAFLEDVPPRAGGLQPGDQPLRSQHLRGAEGLRAAGPAGAHARERGGPPDHERPGHGGRGPGDPSGPDRNACGQPWATEAARLMGDAAARDPVRPGRTQPSRGSVPGGSGARAPLNHPNGGRSCPTLVPCISAPGSPS